MAYSDYGGYAYKNGTRVEDRMATPSNNLPPGCTLADVEGPTLNLCAGCGELFRPSEDSEAVCPRCQHAEDDDEWSPNT